MASSNSLRNSSIARPPCGRSLLLVGLLTLILHGARPFASADADPSSWTHVFDAGLPDVHTENWGMLLILSVASPGQPTRTRRVGRTWNTFRSRLARGESRVRYVVGLFVAIATLALRLGRARRAGRGTNRGGGHDRPDPTGAALDTANLGVWHSSSRPAARRSSWRCGHGFAAAFIARSQVEGWRPSWALFVERFAKLTRRPGDCACADHRRHERRDSRGEEWP